MLCSMVKKKKKKVISYKLALQKLMLLVCKLKAFVSEKGEMDELRKRSHCFRNKHIEEFDSLNNMHIYYEKIKLNKQKTSIKS